MDDRAPAKILVVADGKRGPTATQAISFAQPFDPRHGIASSTVEFEADLPDAARIGEAFTRHSPDVIFLSRYTSPRGLVWLELARVAGIPTIFHLDDDLLAVPTSLGEAKYAAYNDPARLAALRANIDGCDLLYASTPALAEALAAHGHKLPIVAGDIYCSVARSDIGALIAPATGPVIGYMGTSGHTADLAMILPQIIAVMDALPILHFEVFGTIEMPLELVRFGPRVRHLPPVAAYSDFIPYLRSLGWWVGLAPLEDNHFNRCKADTKWVEYSLAGMVVIASDLPVYHRACAGGAGLLCDPGDRWQDAILSLITRPEQRARMIDAAQAKLREHYVHEHLRGQVLDVVDRARAEQGRRSRATAA